MKKKILVVDTTIKRRQPAPILQERSDFEIIPYPSFYRMMTPVTKVQPDLVIGIVRGEAEAKYRIKFLKEYSDTKHIPVMILLAEWDDELASQYTLLADVILPLSINKNELEQNVKAILEGGIQ